MLYFLLCLYVTLYYIRPFEWVPGLVGTPIFLVVAIFSILALLMGWTQGKVRLFLFKTDWMVLGVMVAIVLSHLRHGDFYAVFPSVMTFLPAFVGYYLVAHGISNENQLKNFTLLLIGLSVFLAYEGIRQFHAGYAHGNLEPFYAWRETIEGLRTKDLARIRWYGLFNDPNDLGLALVLPVPFLVDALWARRFLLPVVCLPVLVYALYLTNSRGAMLALFASVFTYVVLRTRSIKGLLLGGALAAFIFVLGPSRMAELSATEGSAYGRVEAWHEGFQMFKSYPLFGVGRGMFTEYHSLTAHNSFMLVLAEIGAVGSLFFLGLFYSPLRFIRISLWKENSLSLTDRSYLCACCGSLIGLIFAMFFLSRSYMFLPYLSVAIFLAYIKLAGHHLSDAMNFTKKEHVVVLMICILFLNFITRILV